MIVAFALTSALSAFLLFLIQPLIAKPILPLLGGSPSVWNTCMLVFQFLLLLGYSYAYLGARRLPSGAQSSTHLALLVGSLLLLPFGLKEAGFDPVAYPQAWLVVTLLQSIGLPYTLLAASAPMLQRWIASTDHPMAGNPYPLYAASNAGSFLALLAYPFFIEPRFASAAQFSLFSNGYAALVGSFALCVILLRQRIRPVPSMSTATSKAPSRQDIAGWIFFGFIPASLLYGVTTYLISDIASVPLLWLIPLMLYLLSFVIAFSDRALPLSLIGRIFSGCAIPVLALSIFVKLDDAVHLPGIAVPMFTMAVIFLGFVYFHRALYLRRPETDRLPFYYVIVALGGVLGGVFNALLAPLFFVSTMEFSLMLCTAGVAALVVDAQGHSILKVNRPLLRWAACYFGLPLLFGLSLRLPLEDFFDEKISSVLFGLDIGAAVFAFLLLMDRFFSSRIKAVVGTIYFMFLLSAVIAEKHGSLYLHRNFFGISKVLQDKENKAHIYVHGTTVHGMQSLEAEKRLNPVSYYVPLRQVFAEVEKARTSPAAVLGLGVGTIACYAQPGQPMDFYEIDPAPIEVARDETLFTYLRDCPGRYDIIVGDGRLELRRAEAQKYGIIVMDAFTSDAIPAHLLTREALDLYATKLQPDGVIAFNISNRFLNLMPVLAALAEDRGWTGAFRAYNTQKPLEASSVWVALFPQAQTRDAFLAAAKEWLPLQTGVEPHFLWTDQYSSLLSVLKIGGDGRQLAAAPEITEEKTEETKE
jgi:spermidine synthase